jgi:hypothetical protein
MICCGELSLLYLPFVLFVRMQLVRPVEHLTLARLGRTRPSTTCIHTQHLQKLLTLEI